MWLSIFISGIVCTVYTSMVRFYLSISLIFDWLKNLKKIKGGLKAVVFTDTFQVFVMFAGVYRIIFGLILYNNDSILHLNKGLIAIIVEGTRKVGGIDVIWNRAIEGDRLELFE